MKFINKTQYRRDSNRLRLNWQLINIPCQCAKIPLQIAVAERRRKLAGDNVPGSIRKMVSSRTGRGKRQIYDSSSVPTGRLVLVHVFPGTLCRANFRCRYATIHVEARKLAKHSMDCESSIFCAVGQENRTRRPCPVRFWRMFRTHAPWGRGAASWPGPSAGRNHRPWQGQSC